MTLSGYKNLQACREHIASKWSFLENGMSSVGAAFEGLNEIIMKWFFLECIGQCLLVHHIISF